MRLPLSLTCVVLLAASAAAHADTTTVYTLSSTFNAPTTTGGSISGTLTYDNTTGQFSAGNLITSGFPTTDGSNGQPLTAISYQGSDPSGFYAILIGNITGAGLQLDLPGNFASTNPVGICTTSSNQANCYQSRYGNTDFSYSAVSGTLAGPTPTSPTPEPSTLALLGTGIIGMAGALRRKLL